MPIDVETQRAYYEAHPPASLAAFAHEPTDLEDHPFDGHPSAVNVVFSLACKCGGVFFTAYGCAHEDEEIAPPITLECDDCGARALVFDAERHGHDGAQGLNAGLYSPAGAPVVLEAEGVASPYEIFVRFEHAPDVIDSPHYAALAPPSELYTWITLVGLTDGQLATLFEHECA